MQHQDGVGFRSERKGSDAGLLPLTWSYLLADLIFLEFDNREFGHGA